MAGFGGAEDCFLAIEFGLPVGVRWGGGVGDLEWSLTGLPWEDIVG